jgi:acetyl esterase/lipase
VKIRDRARVCALLSFAVVVAGFLLVSRTGTLAAEPAAKVELEKNITYGKGGANDLKLDLARPEPAAGLHPALVFIHGGGWVGGSRDGYKKLIQEAAKRGYVAVTVQYRLTDPDKDGKAKNPFPAQIEDVKCAVRWLRANAEKYHIDPHRIGATGESAGGHLSLMLGVTGSAKQLEGTGGNPDASSQVQAVVNYYGPTDLARMYGANPRVDSILRTLIGGTPQERAEGYQAASPATYVTKDVCPILTLHGTTDSVVPVDQATFFDAVMKKAGGTSEVMLLEGQGHGFQGADLQKARKAMFAFFDQHLKNAK